MVRLAQGEGMVEVGVGVEEEVEEVGRGGLYTPGLDPETCCSKRKEPSKET